MSDKPVAPVKQKIYNVNLEQFEHLVYRGRIDEAASEFVDILGKLRTGGEFIGYSVDDPASKLRMYTRVATAIAHLVGNPEFQLSEDGFERLAIQHPTITAIFENSLFGNSDFVAPAFIDNPLERNPQKFVFKHPASIAKFLVMYCLSSDIEMNVEHLCTVAPHTVFPLYVGMIANAVVLTPKAHATREKLLGLSHLFKDMGVSDFILPGVADAYMYASYGVRADRHEVKRTLGRLIRNTMKARGIQELTPREARLNGKSHAWPKPKIIIPIEWMNTHHAMYRCFAPSIMQLRETFHVVAYVRASGLDEHAAALFDEVMHLAEEGITLKDVADKIRIAEPSIIWYPSIGMSPWWTALAQLRLAPIQCMTMGHPASSFSPCIDYAIVEEGQAPDQSLVTEKIVTMPVGSFRFVERVDYRIEPAPYDLVRGFVRIVHVAVPSMVAKLNAIFLDTLRLIKERAEAHPTHSAGVVYHFFPNGLGAWHWQARKLILEQLPGSIVYPRQEYADYIKALQQCHLHFSAYPFGGTNSNVDSFLSGIPVLAKHGPEPHEAFDRLMLQRVGLGELSVDTEQAYLDTAVDLITNEHGLRLATSQLLRREDVRTEFFATPEPGTPRHNAFLQAMEHVLNNHAAIQRGDMSTNWQEYHHAP